MADKCTPFLSVLTICHFPYFALPARTWFFIKIATILLCDFVIKNFAMYFFFFRRDAKMEELWRTVHISVIFFPLPLQRAAHMYTGLMNI